MRIKKYFPQPPQPPKPTLADLAASVTSRVQQMPQTLSVFVLKHYAFVYVFIVFVLNHYEDEDVSIATDCISISFVVVTEKVFTVKMKTL